MTILQAMVVKAEPRHHSGAEILDKHIRCHQQPLENGLAFFRLQIERQRFLAGILRKE